MRALLFFDVSIDRYGRDASVYRIIHSVLRGYVSLVSQRTFTDVNQLWVENSDWSFRNRLILPLGNWHKIKKRASKTFLVSRNLLAIYFDKLPYGEAEKLNSYLYDRLDYLGACQLIPGVRSMLDIRVVDAYMRLENKKATIFLNGFDFFQRKRDIILEEIIKSLPFDSWKYDSRRRNNTQDSGDIYPVFNDRHLRDQHFPPK